MLRPHTFPDLPLISVPFKQFLFITSFSSPSSIVTAFSISDPTLFNPNSMANPSTALFSVLLLFLVSFLVNITASADSPAPAPHFSTDSPPSSPSPSPSLHDAPASNPSPANSPEAPTPAPSHPDSPPAPSPGSIPSPSKSPSPSPADADDEGVNHTDVADMDGKSSGGGMSSGKKAGIAVGVIAAVGVVTLGALVYKKRRQNIQRSQYGYAARRELL